MLDALAEDPKWDEVDRMWIDALLEFDGMPEEHVLERLGGAVQRRDREALQHDIERTVQFFTLRMRDPSISVS